MTKEEIIASFDPNGAAQADAGLYGLPFTADQSDIIIVPVPWEVTVSFGSGAALGPEAIAEASAQVDLHHHDFPELWKHGIYMDTCPEEIVSLGRDAKAKARLLIEAMEAGTEIASDAGLSTVLSEVNHACNRMNLWVKERASYWKSKGKMVGLAGGDHSIPLGYMQLLGELNPEFGILHIDAHMDLRQAYEGFIWSHASIFYNALETVPAISRLVQVGIRDYCQQESDYVKSRPERISVFFDRENREYIYKGGYWHQLCEQIIGLLPQKVYISVDIDGLDARFCPNTGTPVPGGLEYEELVYLLNQLKKSGKEIIGFDLSEVAPGEDGWDGNVGARLLYQLCGILAG